MELYQLRTFVAVADAGNLGRASRLLHASQPAVSAHIKALEEELGVGLFTRTAKGMALTGAGGRLLASSRQVLSRAQAVLEEARAMRGGVVETVRIGRNTDSDFLRLPAILARLAQTHPEALVHVECCDSYNVPDALKNGTIDAGFAYGDCFAEPYTAVAVTMAPVRVVGPAAWRGDLERATPADLAGYPWVWFHERCPMLRMAESLLASPGRGLRTVAVVNDERTIRDLVAAGQGLSLLREDLAMEQETTGKLACWPQRGLTLPLNMVTLSRRLRDPAVKALLDAAGQAWGLDLPDREAL